MITASSDLQALLQSGAFFRADLYTISPVGLPKITLTSADQDITVGGITYSHSGLRITRDRLRLVGGLETDSVKITLTVDQTNEPLINSVPFRQAVQWGLLDGAEVDLSWVYLSGWGPPPVVVGVLPRFVGRAASIGIDRTGVKIEAKSWLVLLDTQVPTQLYQASCRFLLGDANCGVNRETFAKTATVTVLEDTGTISCDLADADGTWNDGWLTMTSGVNSGVRRGIRSYAKGQITLVGPLPWSAAVGDKFKVYPACDKTMPQIASGSLKTKIPATAPYTVSIPNFYSDGGIALERPPIEESFTNGYGEVLWTQMVSQAPLAMANVSAAPTQGQYGVSPSGLYSFAAADAGGSITITYQSVANGSTASCFKLFNNAAKFGGMPFIPVAETAV